MIQAVYHRDQWCLSVEGHAGSGETGHDLVCAGVSTLVYTLAANVGNLDDTGHVRRPSVELEAGRAHISCVPRNRSKVLVTRIFEAVCVGFEILAQNYPAYISYEIHG